MNKIETKLKGVYILEPRVFGDYRGYFLKVGMNEFYMNWELI